MAEQEKRAAEEKAEEESKAKAEEERRAAEKKAGEEIESERQRKEAEDKKAAEEQEAEEAQLAGSGTASSKSARPEKHMSLTYVSGRIKRMQDKKSREDKQHRMQQKGGREELLRSDSTQLESRDVSPRSKISAHNALKLIRMSSKQGRAKG
eukprot:TRINITY_DN1482_c0_g1_i2.p1 TRINITY_DN1482_c0_g1~~TRINITY_DN1482_c0_g1_i2.p1  ORF type:complete len:152 (-),score=51.46 TRINITY_DN1482_c0_g1_i2:15-470(-)